MKRRLYLSMTALMMLVAGVDMSAADKAEMKALKTFLQSPSMDDATNAAALKISNMNDPASWEGVKVENGRIVSIDWKTNGWLGLWISVDSNPLKRWMSVAIVLRRLTCHHVRS